jgi:transposase
MYREGIPVSQIARNIGLSRVTVYTILRKYRDHADRRSS